MNLLKFYLLKLGLYLVRLDYNYNYLLNIVPFAFDSNTVVLVTQDVFEKIETKTAAQMRYTRKKYGHKPDLVFLRGCTLTTFDSESHGG